MLIPSWDASQWQLPTSENWKKKIIILVIIENRYIDVDKMAIISPKDLAKSDWKPDMQLKNL